MQKNGSMVQNIHIQTDLDTTARVFPLEIFEEIIDQSIDDRGCLHRLSLSCRDFLPRVRRHIFFHIFFRHKEKIEASPAFLRTRPWLPPLVGCITIQHTATPSPFMLHVIVPARLIAMLPNLRSLEFSRTESYLRIGAEGSLENSPPYLSFNTPVLSALQNTYTSIQHLELTEVSFRTTIDFQRLVCAFRNMESLICRGVYFRTQFADSGPPPAEGGNKAARDKAPRLKRVVITETPGRRVLNALVDVARDTLEDLTIDLPYSWDHPRLNIKPAILAALSRPQKLRALTLSLDTDRSWDLPTFQPLEAAAEVLSNVCATRLNYLNVIWSPAILASLALDALSASQHPLFKVFEDSIARLPLRTVVFSAARWRKNRRALWVPALKRAFPALHERGILTITERPLTFDRDARWSRTTVGHELDVSSLVAPPDGRFFASCSFDTTIILWDAVRGTILHEWLGHAYHHVNTLAFSPDSHHLLSGGDDATLRIWDISSPSDGVELMHTLPEADHDGGTPGPAPDPNLNIFRCIWSTDDKWLVSLSVNKTLHVWDARDKSKSNFLLHRTFQESAASPFLCPPVFSPDSRWLVWHSEIPGEYFCVWDATAPDDEAPPRRFPACPGEELTSTPCFDPTGARIVTVSGTRLRVWEIATGAQLAVMEGHAGDVGQVSFSPDGGRVLSAARDGTARVWCAESGACVLMLGGTGRGEILQHALFSPDGGNIATVGLDLTVRLWSAVDGACVGVFDDHEGPVREMVFSVDGRRLASGDEEGVVRIRDISGIIER